MMEHLPEGSAQPEIDLAAASLSFSFPALEAEKLANMKASTFESFVFTSHKGENYLRFGWNHPSQRVLIQQGLGDRTIDSTAEGVINRPSPNQLTFIIRYLAPSADSKDTMERLRAMVTKALPKEQINVIDIHVMCQNYRNTDGLISA